MLLLSRHAGSTAGHRNGSHTIDSRQQLLVIATSGVTPDSDPEVLAAAICSLLGVTGPFAAAAKDGSSHWPSLDVVTDAYTLERQLEQLQRGGLARLSTACLIRFATEHGVLCP